MSLTAYSDLKAAWHLDRIRALRDGHQIVPVEMQLILSDLCNHDCHFCAYRATDGLSQEGFVEWEDGKRNHNPNRMIPKEKAFEILEDAAELGVKSIIFTGGGEPTVHPNHMEIFDCALDLGLECSLNTNGALLRKGWEKILPRFAYVRFSIDAGTPVEYGDIRGVPPTTYPKVLENLKHVVEAVRTSDNGCIVGTGYVVTPGNWMNLAKGVRNIRETGAAYVRLASMQSTKQADAYQGGFDDVARVCDSVTEQLSTDDFTVVNLFRQAMSQPSTGSFCGFQQFVTYVGANLKVYRCCYTAYTKLGEIGDLSKCSFREWFDSPMKEAGIAYFNARECAQCPLDGKNKTIRYLTQGTPLHVNFV